jgi:predicted deacetylase
MSPRSIHIVLHDVAPATRSACQRVLDALDQVGSFPLTLLAVPHYRGAGRNSAFERWLVDRAEQGDEVALHGYTHQDAGRPRGPRDWVLRRLYTRAEGEFFDIGRDEALSRVDAGLAWLRDLSLEPAGFVAPAWLMGENAWSAVHERGFVYTCTLRRLHLLRVKSSVDCQSQVFSTSSAWRRRMSTHWNETLARMQQAAPIVRLELHPFDADHPAVRTCWQQLARQQARDREATTLSVLASRLEALRMPSIGAPTG